MSDRPNTSSGGDLQVRIGELAATSHAGQLLVTVGLGSCVGVSLVDPASGAVALAHVFLPEVPPSGSKLGAGPGTYAPEAVPALVRALQSAGVRTPVRDWVAIIAGGARMFAARSGADVGERNVHAVKAALAAAGIRIVAEDTGGSHGRTMRVLAGVQAQVTARQVGQVERALWTSGRVADASSRVAA